jgi:hypothetical protein
MLVNTPNQISIAILLKINNENLLNTYVATNIHLVGLYHILDI